MRYFLTGATGFIGHALAQQLVAAGHEVITVARRPDRAQQQVDIGVEVRKGDITDKESMRDAMTGVDGVFHLAAWYEIGARDTSHAERVNVGGTRSVLELMRELHIHRGVYTSSLAVNSDTHGKVVDETYHKRGPFLSEYDRTKWVAHHEVAVPMMEHGLPLTIVMPGVVYGPGDTSTVHDTFSLYLRRKLLLTPKQTAFCWAHVEDTARGILLAMEKGVSGETYMICGPAHTLVDVFATAERVTGIPAPRRHPGPGLMRLLAAVTGVAGKVVRLPEMYAGETLRVMAGTTYLGSNAKARQALGFSARPLEQGLRETFDFISMELSRPQHF